MRVVALYRVSTERQAEEGASLDAQERKYRELAKAQDWQTVGEFRGCESASQSATERRVLQQVLACIREQEVDAVWVIEQSRLTRGDQLEVALLFRELQERGIKVIVNETIRDLASIDERFMLGIQSLVDRAEVERFRERVKRGKRERARQGRKNCGIAPYGYRNPPAGDPQHGVLQVVLEEARIVRRIFEMIANGLSDRSIIACLNAESVPAPRGRSWGRTTIRRILQNPVYVGTHASNVWLTENGSRSFRFQPRNPNAIIVENAHQAIVTRELWNTVHDRPRCPRTAKPHVLTGLLWVDGVRVSGDAIRGRPYYCDRNRERGRAWLPVSETDQLIWQAFVSISNSPHLIDALFAAAKGRQPRKQLESQVKRLAKQREKLADRLQRLVDMRADGEISKTMFMERSDSTRNQLAQVESQLRAARIEQLPQDEGVAERVVKAVQTLVSGDSCLTKDQQRRALQSIVRRIDATAMKQDSYLIRDRYGRVTGTTGQRWQVKDVAFHLAIPAASRDRQLDTSC